MYYFIYVLWFMFLVVVNQMRRRWTIFKIFKSKISSSLSSKASESLNNSIYYSFSSYNMPACNVNMSPTMFTFPYHFLVALVVGLPMGSIVLLSPTIIALVWSHYS
jgi:hypothetical protein